MKNCNSFVICLIDKKKLEKNKLNNCSSLYPVIFNSTVEGKNTTEFRNELDFYELVTIWFRIFSLLGYWKTQFNKVKIAFLIENDLY